MRIYLMPVFLVMLLFISSCKKYLDVNAPLDKQSSATIYADSLSASNVVVGIYINMVGGNNSIVSAITRYTSLSSDELTYLGGDDGTQFLQNDILVSNDNLNTLWINLYAYIHKCNVVIEGVNGSASLSAGAKKVLTGETKFLRSFCFFYLINLWGDVPLTLVSDYRVNENMPRTPVNLIYDQMIKDLKDAQNDLPADYPTAERVRPDKQVATALLARVYLYTHQWPLAEEESSKVIASGDYVLNQKLTTTFLKTSRETIWQLPSTDDITYGAYDAAYFVPPSASSLVAPNYPIRSTLYNAFENGDKRKAAWTGNKNVGTKSYKYPFKYRIRRGTIDAIAEYNIMLRLSEQYLIRAEARVKQGNIYQAVSDIDSIRSKAGLPFIDPTISADSAMQLVLHERYVEYFCEWGNRWFDLKRNQIADVILKPLKSPNWAPEDVLYPIPLNQILLNPFLKQNNGY